MLFTIRRISVPTLLTAAFATAIFTFEPAAAPTDDRRAATSQNGMRLHYPPQHLPILTLPNGNRRSIRSVLNVTHAQQHGDYVWNDTGVPTGPVWVRADLALQTLSVFRGGHEIGSAVILYGADRKPTPEGVYPILAKAKHHRSNLYDADMPYMLRLTGDGIAIHASKVRAGSATHGCIGVPLAFAKRLFREVERGDPVAIFAP
ncbi:L,D-transpeptidase family protein [Novosphingobium sp. M1R2S20]|uniref:L,D-transpeptidase family protein n=1 Tax=Novosphingobium rhizovicinum TaxID=3228928 RepID=A0ABV3R7Z6_9SPHN